MTLDLLLENARVVDGTGAPWFHGAVGVLDGEIDVVVRRRTPALDAKETVDLAGQVVCPGFVDPHSHSDLRLFTDPALTPKVRQGITTEVLGQDGFSMAPMYREGGPAEWQDHLRGLAGPFEGDWSWGSTASYLDAIAATGTAINLGTHVGHGTVRYNVMGMADRTPTDEELTEMGDLVVESLEDGALGLSTGLVYPPQINADTDELVALCERLSPFGRPFVAHIRSEGHWLWTALDEFTDVGAAADVPVHLSHYKLAGTEQHGYATRANGLIEAARERGIDFTAEQYPYTAGNTVLSSVLPPWVFAEGRDQALAYLDDPDARKRMRRDILEWRIDGWENAGARTGWENIEVANISSDDLQKFEGETVAAVARAWDVDPVEAVCDLLLEDGLTVSMISHSQSIDDVRAIMANERVAVCTDGLFGGKPHPRTYGTYPRILGQFVREENLLTLEMAVRKMTSLPARQMGLDRKGLIRPGMDADLVVVDPLTVDSPATFDDPKQFPRGLPHVIVDGTFVVRDGSLTDARPGSVVRA